MEVAVEICCRVGCGMCCEAICKSHPCVPISSAVLLSITFLVLGILGAASVIGVGVGTTVGFFLIAALPFFALTCTLCCNGNNSMRDS